MSAQTPTMTQQSSPAWLRLRDLAAANSMLVVALLLLIIFGLTAQNFLSGQNIFNIFRQMSVIAVLGIGMTIVILIGGIDLSVGSILFLAGSLTAAQIAGGTPTPVAIIIGLGAAVLVGFLNGLIIEVIGISPVITTLAGLIGVRGLALVLINNAQIRVTDPFFEYIAVTRTPGIPQITLPGLPLLVIIVFVLYLIFAVLMRQTQFGRRVYAVGGNPVAARLCGVRVRRIRILAYTICGFTAGIAGMLMIASTGVVSPNLGAGSEFYTIAAVVLGGTRLTGGIGRVEKTLIGAFVVYMVLNYMTIRRIPTEWQQAVTGLLVLAAVLVDRFTQRGRSL
ncbi:ABC transporter permease [Anaerolineae bacterium CFX9]|nr:ABC transporter permease [Anaerolineae bacterium CFX9]